ncbi:hypothetical protein P9112_013016 [Eukaryota sp. TZLM1-RC]
MKRTSQRYMRSPKRVNQEESSATRSQLLPTLENNALHFFKRALSNIGLERMSHCYFESCLLNKRELSIDVMSPLNETDTAALHNLKSQCSFDTYESKFISEIEDYVINNNLPDEVQNKLNFSHEEKAEARRFLAHVLWSMYTSFDVDSSMENSVVEVITAELKVWTNMERYLQPLADPQEHVSVEDSAPQHRSVFDQILFTLERMEKGMENGFKNLAKESL